MIYPILLIAATLLFAAITWRDVRHGLIFLAAALPSYLIRFDLGPIPMTLLEAFALVLVAIWLIQTIPLGLRPRGLLPPGWLLPIALLLTAATISVFVAPDTLSALGIWKAYFVEPILVFVVAVDILGKLKETKYKNELLMALGAGGLFVALVAIAQYVTGQGIPVPWDIEQRVTSIFPYPNAVGLYLGPVIVISAIQTYTSVAAGFSLRRDVRTLKGAATAFHAIVFIVSSIAIILSQSEAAIVSIAATLLVAGLATKRLRKFGVLLVALVALVALVSPSLLAKLTFNDYSGQVRRSQWRETVTMLKDRPVFGAGLNGYPSAIAPYHEAEQYEIFQYPHTLVLNIWTELGLLGLIAFAMLASRVAATWRGAVPPPITTTLAFLTLIQMSIHGLADVPYFKNDLAMMTWLILAVIAASAYAKVPGKQV